MKIKVFVLPDGSVVARQMDLLVPVLSTPKVVRRITTVDWDESQSEWVVRTLTEKPLFASTLRKVCLDYEAKFVERLMSQFFMCRDDAGQMICPDCRCHLGNVIHNNCPYCGFGFPSDGRSDLLEWTDFKLFERMVLA